MRENWSLTGRLLGLASVGCALALFAGAGSPAAAAEQRCPVVPTITVATLGKPLVTGVTVPFVLLTNWFGYQPVGLWVTRRGPAGNWVSLAVSSPSHGTPGKPVNLVITETTTRPVQAGMYRVQLFFQVNAKHRAMLQAENCGSGRAGSIGSFETVDGPPNFMFKVNIFRRIG